MIKRLLYIILTIVFVACCKDPLPPTPDPEPGPTPGVKDSTSTPVPPTPGKTLTREYVWDDAIIPEIHINITKEEFNKLLGYYDSISAESIVESTSAVECNFSFIKGTDTTNLTKTALRLRDNEDARRPYGSKGQKYGTEGAKWNLASYEVDFKSLNDEATINSTFRRMMLKSCYNDPSYAREKFSYNMMEDFGIWTSSKDSYCKLYITVDKKKNTAYLGVYQMIESINQDFLTQRAAQFKTANGNLWKCDKEAFLNTMKGSFGVETESGSASTYTLLTNLKDFSTAKQQLQKFMQNFVTLKDAKFQAWIEGVCDVDLLLKTYAANVALGMWDDYWNRGNNYYIYFNTKDVTNYQVYFIPYDYEMTLGNSKKGYMLDSGTHDPLAWGSDKAPLIAKLLTFEKYRDIYIDHLYDLIDPYNFYFNIESAPGLIKKLMKKVNPYVSNDTGINMIVRDAPASWSSTPDYRMTDYSEYNYFLVKSQTISKIEQ